MASSIQIVDSQNQLPKLWNRSAIFFANLSEIFFENTEKTDALGDAVGPSSSYGERLIPTVDLLFRRQNNLLVLERAPSRTLCDYFSGSLDLSLPRFALLSRDEYRRLGSLLKHPGARPDSPLWPALEGHLETHPEAQDLCLDGFVTDGTLERLASQLGFPTVSTPEGSRRGNNKLLLHRFLESNNLPVVPTEVAESQDRIPAALKALDRQGFNHAVVKSQFGASGIGLRRVKIGEDDGSDIPDYYFAEGPCLVQGWIQPGAGAVRTVRSPSVQFFLSDSTATLFDITEQHLTAQSVHCGNESPPPYIQERPKLAGALKEQAAAAMQWLHEQGFRGLGGVDFLVVDRAEGSQPEVYICEINARPTAASYPSILSRHFLENPFWVLRNISFTKDTVTSGGVLGALEASGKLFRRGGEGIMPLNLIRSGEGYVKKGQFLCLARSRSQLMQQLLYGLPPLRDIGD